MIDWERYEGWKYEKVIKEIAEQLWQRVNDIQQDIDDFNDNALTPMLWLA